MEVQEYLVVISDIGPAFDAMEDSPIIVFQLPIIVTLLFIRRSAGFSGLLLLRLPFHAV